MLRSLFTSPAVHTVCLLVSSIQKYHLSTVKHCTFSELNSILSSGSKFQLKNASLRFYFVFCERQKLLKRPRIFVPYTARITVSDRTAYRGLLNSKVESYAWSVYLAPTDYPRSASTADGPNYLLIAPEGKLRTPHYRFL